MPLLWTWLLESSGERERLQEDSVEPIESVCADALSPPTQLTSPLST